MSSLMSEKPIPCDAPSIEVDTSSDEEPSQPQVCDMADEDGMPQCLALFVVVLVVSSGFHCFPGTVDDLSHFSDLPKGARVLSSM